MKLGDTVMYKTGCTEYTVVAIEYNSSFVTILSSKSDNSYLAAKSRLVVVKSFLQKGDRMLKFKFKVSQEVMFKAEYEGCCVVNKWLIHSGYVVVGKEFFDVYRKNAYGKIIWKKGVDAVHLIHYKTRRDDKVTLGLGVPKFVSERQWQFDVTSKYQIDMDRISEDLNKENPIALVRLSNSDNVFLLVNGPLEDRLVWCKGGRKFANELKKLYTSRVYFLENRYSSYVLKSIRNVNAFMNIFKAVNVAPVRKSLHEKNTVMVSLQKMS